MVRPCTLYSARMAMDPPCRTNLAALHRQTEHGVDYLEGGFRPFAGAHAGDQPPDIPDVLLHETAIAWVKVREWKTKPPRPWGETREAFTTRMRGIAQEVNASCDVEGLCRGFVKRLEEVVEGKGGRLRR